MIGYGMKWVGEVSLSILNHSFWEVRISRSPGRGGLGHDAQINAKGVLGPSNQRSKAEGGTRGVRSLRNLEGPRAIIPWKVFHLFSLGLKL